MKINFLSVFVAMGLVIAAPLLAKEGRTYFTPSRIDAAKANVAQHDWAKSQFDRVLNQQPFDPLRDGDANKSYRSAKYLISKSNDEIYAFMPPITVGRQSLAEGTTLCPVHGDKIRKRSAYVPWKFDFENKPWKLICPIGGESYPSNDFAAGDTIVHSDARRRSWAKFKWEI